MNTTAVATEWHLFLEDILEAAKGRAIRPEYEQRRLLTRARHVVLRTDVAGKHLDDLRWWQVGPRQIHWHPEPERFIETSTLGDLARRDNGVGGFWYGELEHELRQSLGINGGMTPHKMTLFNNKGFLRQVAELLGLEHLFPMNRICRTREEMAAAEREIMNHPRDGHPIPDFAMGKITCGLSGAGMEFFRDSAARQRFYEKYVDSRTPLICEAAWDASRVTVLSVHFNVTETIARVGHTLNVIENGRNHCGNTMVGGNARLQGVSLDELEQAYRMCMPFVWHLKNCFGLRGKIGFDLIRVTDVYGASRWYIIEANAIRPPAPRYGLALGETLAPRLNGGWGISMVEVETASGAAWSYDQLVKLLAHPRWGRLYFNGVTGVIPLLTNLLNPPPGFHQKFIAVCVGRSSEESLLMLDRVRWLTGCAKLEKEEAELD